MYINVLYVMFLYPYKFKTNLNEKLRGGGGNLNFTMDLRNHLNTIT